MFYYSGNLTITLICATIGFIASIIYSKIRSGKITKENEIIIRNATKEWVESEKKRVQKSGGI